MSISVMLEKLQPGDLPTPPAIALKIIHSCADPTQSSQHLAKIISSDTAILAELLRMANSPFFGIRQEITTAARATVVLGNRAIRNLTLCFAVREAIRPELLPDIDAQEYWENILRRAVSARMIAEKIGAEADEAFTIGMLQDIGSLALVIINPQQGHVWPQLQAANPDERLVMEKKLFDTTHDEVGEIIAQHWNLPAQISTPIAQHHKENLNDVPAETSRMCNIAEGADWMSAVYTADDKRLALAMCRRLMAKHFELEHGEIEELLVMIPEEIENAAHTLDIKIPEQLPFEDILQHANKQLIADNITHEARTVRIEKALEDRERIAMELQEAYDHISRMAYFDPLTALVNRRRFEEVFLSEIARHCRSGQPLSLVMLDLDQFKTLNDTYGHTFGDVVLQAVSSIHKTILRTSDMAARYGGDEICLLLPETDKSGGKIAAKRLREAIAELKLPTATNQEIDITASLGGCTWKLTMPDDMTTKDIMVSIKPNEIMTSIIEVADNALYKSKNNGRNQITWA